MHSKAVAVLSLTLPSQGRGRLPTLAEGYMGFFCFFSSFTASPNLLSSTHQGQNSGEWEGEDTGQESSYMAGEWSWDKLAPCSLVLSDDANQAGSLKGAVWIMCMFCVLSFFKLSDSKVSTA